jgi:hypothetical protein
MLEFKKLIEALNTAGITPELLFKEDYSAEQEGAVFDLTGCKPNYVAWADGSDFYDRIFLFNGGSVNNTSYYVRVRRYTGGGGGEFDEARFEQVEPVQEIVYRAVKA